MAPGIQKKKSSKMLHRLKHKQENFSTAASDSNLSASHGSTQPKREPPRSANLFKVGPPFDSILTQNYIVTLNEEFVRPVISARIDRGFDLVDKEWMGYKRNYFTAVVSFKFHGVPDEIALKNSYWCMGPDTSSKRTHVEYFMVRLGCECIGPEEAVVKLIQHTAKRDHGPQNEPPTYNMIPGTLPDHFVIRKISNVRNNIKMSESDRYFFLDESERKDLLRNSGNKLLQKYPSSEKISIAAKYDRIQFQFAPSLTAKRNTNTRFVLKVDLLARLDCGRVVRIITAKTPSLLIRSRSPSTYSSLSSVVQARKPRKVLYHKEEPAKNKITKFYDAKKLLAPKNIFEDALELRRTSMMGKPTQRFELPLKDIELNTIGSRKNNLFEDLSSISQSRHALSCRFWQDHCNQFFVNIHWKDAISQKRIQSIMSRNEFFVSKNAESVPEHQSIHKAAPEQIANAIDEGRVDKEFFGLQSPFLERSEDANASTCLLEHSRETADKTHEDLITTTHNSLSYNASLTNSPMVSSFERLDKAMRAYEKAKVTLDALNQLESTCSSLGDMNCIATPIIPFELFLLGQISTSTPLLPSIPNTPLAIPELILKRDRCIHGSRKRGNKQIPKVFTQNDHDSAYDSSFERLTKEISSRRQLLEQLTPFSETELTLTSVSCSQAEYKIS